MRKYDIFGKKINQNRTLILIFIIFIVVVGGYMIIQRVQQKQLDDLNNQEDILQNQIDNLLETEQPVTYYSISEIVQYLPNTFNQSSINNQIESVKNTSGLSDVENYSITFHIDTTSPFDEPLPDTIRYTRITLSFIIDNPSHVLDFIDDLYAVDLIYYVDQVNVQYTEENNAIVQIILYTFYNHVDIL